VLGGHQPRGDHLGAGWVAFQERMTVATVAAGRIGLAVVKRLEPFKQDGQSLAAGRAA